MYPYGEEQKDKEMNVDLIKRGDCEGIDNDDGYYFYDAKRYRQFVSVSIFLINRNLRGQVYKWGTGGSRNIPSGFMLGKSG